MITWANFVSQLFNGLALGALLALISSGLTIIYGTLGVLNLAHGAMFMLGGYAGFMAYQATGSFVVAVLAGMLALLVVGLAMERLVIRHFYARPHEDQLLLTFGLSIVFVEAIRFFEEHAADRFTLFGPGWDIPAVAPGHLGRIVKRLHEWRRRLAPGTPAAFPSWRGTVERKHEVLDRARFSICYENSRGSPGYMSEKIFDCLTSGCVPVYIGTSHSRPPIPEDCFIDGDQFGTPSDMLAYIERIDAGHFAMYQQCIREFLASDEAQRFTNEHWCETLVTRILSDVQQA